MSTVRKLIARLPYLNPESPIFNTDSYKISHYLQDPANAGNKHYYLEARGGPYKETVLFGLQYILQKYLSKPVLKEEVEAAEHFYKGHMGVFDRMGWDHILNKHGGYLPVEIKAAPEGLRVPVKNAIVSAVSTDHRVRWVAGWIEAMLLRGIWYPTSVATLSYNVRQSMIPFWEKTSNEPIESLDFKLHDFGARGGTSLESVALAGAAHLAVGWKGSDTVSGILLAHNHYAANMAGFSIPAAEHSTITAWGKNREVDAYINMLNTFGDHHHFAVVSDSYDLWNAITNIWGRTLKKKVLEAKGVLVIRPDSGVPVDVVKKCLHLLAESFGFTVNAKGFKVLNKVRVIQGDGVNPQSIVDILTMMVEEGFSIDNIAFGMGGQLHQAVDRDTMKWAMKCSAIEMNSPDNWVDVYKDPITDPGKASKAGILGLFYGKHGFTTERMNHGFNFSGRPNYLQPVFANGEILREYDFEEVRANTLL
jgi:nicotinamide phosphoribosyltransferase